MIAAMTPRRVIGRAGTIPWRHKADLQHFKAKTMGHAVIMGRLTYDSIGKPLAGRRNLVVTRDAQLRLAGCEIATTLQRALELAYEQDPEPFVIGGAQLYEAALPLATKLELTYLDDEHEGDVFFPALDERDWRETERRRGDGLTWVTLVRR
jgi:dihydrofolate reductase